MRRCIVVITLGMAATPLHAEPAAQQAAVPVQPNTFTGEHLRQQERLLGIARTPPAREATRRSEIERRPAADLPASAKPPGVQPRAASTASGPTPLETRMLLGTVHGSRPAAGVGTPTDAASTRAQDASSPARLQRNRDSNEAENADPLASSNVPVQLTAFETEYLTRRSHIPAQRRCERFTIAADDIAFSRLDERQKRVALASLLDEASSHQCLAAPK